MKLFEDGLKSVKEMNDDELHNMVAMLRKLRADSLTSATKSIKQRKARATAKEPKQPKAAKAAKTINLKQVNALLTPEQQEMFKKLLAQQGDLG